MLLIQGCMQALFSSFYARAGYAWAWEARPEKPGPARKSWAWAAVFGPMGGPGQRKYGPTVYSGRAWVAHLDDFGKARPESPMARREIAYSGRAWASIFRPDCRAGPALGSHFVFRALSWPGPARQDAQV
jgi:hypothetical protein